MMRGLRHVHIHGGGGRPVDQKQTACGLPRVSWGRRISRPVGSSVSCASNGLSRNGSRPETAPTKVGTPIRRKCLPASVSMNRRTADGQYCWASMAAVT